MNQVIKRAVNHLTSMKQDRRNWQMPGDARYQPDDLKPFLGYDQWAGWLIIVEWMWMKALAVYGVMPRSDANYLTDARLFNLLNRIATADQDAVEYGRPSTSGIVTSVQDHLEATTGSRRTSHDILALLALMRRYLPKRLHRWLHFTATSYDIIDTAYALQLRWTIEKVWRPKLLELDKVWRQQITASAGIVQAGRTHLQTALPVTVGFWLACLHRRFVETARRVDDLSRQIPGKFSGATGTKASQIALALPPALERELMDSLGLPWAELSTQITFPEDRARFYCEVVLMSGALANLGHDARLLQSSQFGELTSASSSSSAMPHKTANPIAAENVAGMHVTVLAEFQKVMMTLSTNLQRDLTNSNVMRSYSAVLVYAYQQLRTALRLLKTMKFDLNRIEANFRTVDKLVVAELLHLALQVEGVADTHHLVNGVIVPLAVNHIPCIENEMADLATVMSCHIDEGCKDLRAVEAWNRVPDRIKNILREPAHYIGRAKIAAEIEGKNALRFAE